MKKLKKILAVVMTLIIVSTLSACDNVTISSNKDKISINIKENVKTKTEVLKTKMGEMQVHFIDVGQADSTLIVSEGKYMLIDAGNNADGNLVVEYLKNQGVKTLDYVIGTHPHEDHIGGLDDVINSFDIKTVIMPKKMHTTKTFESVIDAISNKGLKITQPIIGDVYDIGNAKFTIIAPIDKNYKKELNNWSVGIKLVNGENRFIISGDSEKEAEEDTLATGIDLKADVYQVNHHGSRSSSSKEYLEAISPKFAIISCGLDNDYGHPHKETIEKFKDYGIKYLRTDKNGTIVAISDGKNISWKAEYGSLEGFN